MITRLYGWGNSLASHTYLEMINPNDNCFPLKNDRGAIARGLGRSYGDSAANSGGVTLETQLLNKIEFKLDEGLVVVGSGVTIQKLEAESMKYGYFPYVVPGTAFVTVGGAIASDIHGKSHHKIGSFSNFVTEMTLLLSDGTFRRILPRGDTSNLFWATVGGMGLTGIVVEATLKLQEIETSFLQVEEHRVKDLDGMLTTLTQLNEKYLYTVAWVDLSGKYKGRGVVSGANHLELKHLTRKLKTENLTVARQRQLVIPKLLRFGLVNGLTTRIFNSFWFHKPLGKRIQQIQRYMHPLDSVTNWNTLYGKSGFLQHQFVIPFEKSYVMREVLSRLKDARCSSSLTVLKSFGEDSKGMLGFPMQGWTLAIDLPLHSPHSSEALKEIDRIVMEAGGRLYLTKDSRMNPEHLAIMYPRLAEWKEIKNNCDPNNSWQSDQGRRLRLC